MDQLEFCNAIKEAKRMSGKTNVDIVIATRKSEGTLSDMVNARTDFSLGKYLPYINAIDFVLALQKKDTLLYIHNTEDALKWLTDEFSQSATLLNVLSKELGISRQTLYRILRGGTLRISIFLKLAEIFGYHVFLEPKAPQP